MGAAFWDIELVFNRADPLEAMRSTILAAPLRTDL